ncbi:hypothetical protein [Polynucleobacter victoriensis]|uniref:Uncharacterized protein n=1 Tax=Polynucleobacter victoriensis TaxID=2049319 RepID=A0A212T6Q7_9BURK|nr:hypothetical protein [Polynucleobacter victoriensis]SNC61737.1 hypothetical protein SAMN06295916_0536 [Polynucleobacter victoriensis]
MKENKQIDLERLRKDSHGMMKAISREAMKYQFVAGSHNSIKLRRSLALIERLDLVNKTLLSTDIHKVHSKRLADRYINKWNKFKKSKIDSWSKLPLKIRKQIPKPNDCGLASSHLRFFTLIDSVTEVNHKSALGAVKKMKTELLKKLKLHRGLWCVGVVECEVISLKMMKEIQRVGKNTNSEKRKLGVCDVLATDIKNSIYRNEDSLFLIHFHGVLLSTKEETFTLFNDSLRKSKQWSKAPRQIEIKKLSESFGGKGKTTDRNLKDISTYITKGGNDWCFNKSYLRYKIGFELDDSEVIDETTWVLKNWRRSEQLRKEHSEDGIEDSLSMTPSEIAELTLLIDQIMSLNRTRTGYLISTGS